MGNAAAVYPEEFAGKPCMVGLDLAATMDMSAAAILWPHPEGGYAVAMKYYLPGHELRKRAERDHAPYLQWRDEGYLTTTEGDVQDYAVIERDILDLHKRYGIRELCFDRYNSSALITRLMAAGITCVPIGQGFLSMAAPVNEFERLVLQKQLRHGGNPVLGWNLANTQLEVDAAGNRKPSKGKSTGRIDGISALLTALSRCIVSQPAAPQFQFFVLDANPPDRGGWKKFK
jgi:phage terminase large subunit-like protein